MMTRLLFAFLLLLPFALLSNHEDLPDVPLKTFVGEYGPMTVAPGEMRNWTFHDVARPMGDVAIATVKFSLIDATTNQVVRLENVYMHHVGLWDQEGVFPLTMIGAEGYNTLIEVSTMKGRPFRIVSKADRAWKGFGMLINTWGLITQANMTCFVRYELGYNLLEEVPYVIPADLKFFNAGGEQSLFGKSETFQVDPESNDLFIKEKVVTWPDDSLLVECRGHFHIGGFNITVHDHSTNELICASYPFYSETNYIISTTQTYPMIELKKNGKYKVAAHYSAGRVYKKLMGYMFIYVVLDYKQYSDKLKKFLPQ